MNFYIGNSIGKIDKQDVNVEFSDKLINFIYKLRGQVSFDMSKLYEIAQKALSRGLGLISIGD